jgi:hypothetical protein
MSSSFPTSTSFGIGLTLVIALILLSSHFTVIDAQQQLLTSQSEEVGNRITTPAATKLQSTNDSFSIQVPDGWIAYDINNSTSELSEEITRGYGLIAQLCSQEEQQQRAEAFSNNASGSTSNNSCQGAQEEVVHIVRYPDLDTRLLANNITTANNNITISDNIVSYQLQKLQEAGYRSMRIIATTDMAVNLTNPHTSETIAILPAKLVEMTYGTNIAPNEIRRGYLFSTATNSTTPNPDTTKGYALFYEGNSTTTNATAAIMNMAGSLSLPTPIQQLFDSFELTVAPELAPTSLQQVAQSAEFTAEDPTDDDDDDDNGGSNDDDDDDNGGSNDDDDDDNGGSNDDNDCENIGGTSCDDDYDGDSDDGGDDGGNDDDDDDNGGSNDDNDCENIGGTSCDDDYG